MSDDERNGGRSSIHPDIGDFGVEDEMDVHAAAALAAQTARRQKLADDDIAEIEDALARIELGDTPWQRSMRKQLQSVVDQIQILKIARIAWPGITAAAILFFGGVCAELVWRIATTH